MEDQINEMEQALQKIRADFLQTCTEHKVQPLEFMGTRSGLRMAIAYESSRNLLYRMFKVPTPPLVAGLTGEEYPCQPA